MTQRTRRYASLRGRREFALVIRRGRSAATKHMVVFALARQVAEPPTKVGIIVTKKVGKAVDRNLLRRRCKAILDVCPLGASGMWFVVQCKPASAALSFAQLREQLISALGESSRRAGNDRRRREVGRQ